MSALASFGVVLWAATDRRHVLVGTDVAGRTRGDSVNVVGLFVNQLALRLTINPEESFREWLRRVRAVVLAAFENDDVPFEWVVRAVAPPRKPWLTPLFQVKLVMQEPDPPVLRLGDAIMRPQPVAPLRAKFDVLLNLEPRGERVEGFLEHRVDIVDDTRAHALVEQFRACVSWAAADPDRRLADAHHILRDIAEQSRQAHQVRAVSAAAQSLGALADRQRPPSRSQSHPPLG